jgi:hypothetical protein
MHKTRCRTQRTHGERGVITGAVTLFWFVAASIVVVVIARTALDIDPLEYADQAADWLGAKWDDFTTRNGR